MADCYSPPAPSLLRLTLPSPSSPTPSGWGWGCSSPPLRLLVGTPITLTPKLGKKWVKVGLGGGPTCERMLGRGAEGEGWDPTCSPHATEWGLVRGPQRIHLGKQGGGPPGLNFR